MQGENAQSFIFDVTEADFEARVLDRSVTVPVLVLFWSRQSQSSLQLMPVLEKLASEFKGAFEFAKVDVEACPRLAMMLRLRSLPTTYLFKEGQPLDGFVGMQDEKQARGFLSSYVTPPEADPLESGRAAFAAGDLDLAERCFTDALTDNPDQHEAHLALARIALSRGDTELADAWIKKIPEEDAQYAAAQRLKEVFAFSAFAGDELELRKRVADEDSADAYYRLGATLACKGRFEEALEAFLAVVARDRSYREDAGRKAVVSLFDLIGSAEPVVVQARRRLASYLF